MSKFFSYEDGQIHFKIETIFKKSLAKYDYDFLSFSVENEKACLEYVDKGKVIKSQVNIEEFLEHLDHWIRS